MTPYHAYRHFEEAPYLGPSDRDAAELLFTGYRQATKRAKRMEHILDIRTREMEARIKELEAAIAVLEGSNG